MAARSPGISGFGIAMATGGALLMYAGFRDVTPLQALRETVGSGRLPTGAGPKSSGAIQRAESALSGAGAVAGGGIVSVGAGAFPQLVQAVQPFMGDQYSQLRRWQNGFSDCSSFIGKGLKRLGEDPGISTTLSYLASRDWSQVPRSAAGAGDIAVNQAHMVLFTGPGTAVGQQRPGRNVQSGTPEELMSGTGTGFVVLRYRKRTGIAGSGRPIDGAAGSGRPIGGGTAPGGGRRP